MLPKPTEDRHGGVVIPEMTHPLSKHWDQPDWRCFVFRDDKVYLTRPAWDALSAYDTSYPSGVYEGKMWRASGVDSEGPWQQLRWYDVSPNPNKCSIKYRAAVVCEGMRRDDGRVCRLANAAPSVPAWALCDAWSAQAMITNEQVTCLACIAGEKADKLRCSLCAAPVGDCSHTRRTP